MERVVVVGSSCSGKTTFARALAETLAAAHVELDALNWLPGWQERPPDEFRRLVAEAVARERWIVEGNYGRVRDLVWPRATALIWLNFSFGLVLRRALGRSFRRITRRELVCNGNRETFATTFLSHDSLLLWIVHRFHRRRAEYRALFDGEAYPAAARIEFRHPREADRFMAEMQRCAGRASAVAT